MLESVGGNRISAVSPPIGMGLLLMLFALAATPYRAAFGTQMGGTSTGDSLTTRRSVQRLWREWVPTAPKTVGGERTLVNPARLSVALRSEKTRQNARRLRARATWRDERLVFSTIRGKPLYKDCVPKALRVTCDRRGVPPLTPHGLRHLSASLLLSENVPDPNVRQQLGHSDPSIAPDLAGVA